MAKASLNLLATVVLLVFALAFMTVPSHAGDSVWTWTGLSGTARQIVVAPSDPGVVYAVIGFDRIYKSTDGGVTWTPVTPSGLVLPAGSIERIAVAPGDAQVVFVTTSQQGTYRSLDGGSTWLQIMPPNSNSEGAGRHLGIAVSPVDWKEVYLVATVGSSEPFDLNVTTFISKTLDGGLTWNTVWERGGNSSPLLDAIVIAPSAPHIVYAKPCYCGDAAAILYKSTDAGGTWGEVSTPYTGFFPSLAVDPLSSNILYLGSASPAAWKSVDGGANWQPLANGLSGFGFEFVVNPNNTQVVHGACNEAGAYESVDAGGNWVKIDAGIEGLSVVSIGIVDRAPLTLLAGVGSAGIWRYTKTDVQDYSVSINDGALYTPVAGVTLSLTAPPRTSEMMISNDGGFGGAAWEQFQGVRNWTLTDSGSSAIPRTVYVKFRTSGKISPAYQDDIVLDVTAPDGTLAYTETVQLAGNGVAIKVKSVASSEDDVLFLPFVARPRAVRLLLSASDDLSGVGEMLISNSADFADAAWEPYAGSKDWPVISSTGPVIVYAKYRDRAGNQSQPVSVEVQP